MRYYLFLPSKGKSFSLLQIAYLNYITIYIGVTYNDQTNKLLRTNINHPSKH
jgi:hypothetical protein